MQIKLRQVKACSELSTAQPQLLLNLYYKTMIFLRADYLNHLVTLDEKVSKEEDIWLKYFIEYTKRICLKENPPFSPVLSIFLIEGVIS